MKTVISLVVILLLALAAAAQATTATVTRPNANLRGTPLADGRIVEKLKRDLEVTIYKIEDEWYLVQSPNIAGWIRREDIWPDAPGVAVPINDKPVKDPVIGYVKGTKGRCYYINASGRKAYVDRSYCH